MKTLPPGLASHLDGPLTTVCHAWRLMRRDGIVFGFTDHDHDLSFAGTAFQAASGFEGSGAQSALGLSVETDDVAGALSADCISETDLAEGRFDGATVEVFLVNWQAPASQHVLLRTQDVGEVTRSGEAFRAELRGLVNRLDQVQGRVYARRCDAVLGDRRCRVDLENPAYRGDGVVVSGKGTEGCTASGLDAFADGWFRQGLLTWTSGANSGLSVEIDEHTAGNDAASLSFWAPLANTPQPGDRFTVTAGCAKTFGVCRAKFSNQLNFQGFPHMPGTDFAYGYADAETVHDGRPIVP